MLGTLHEQLPRQQRLEIERVESTGIQIQKISNDLKISFADALNLYLAVAKIDDYDVKDEQLSGLGEIFEQIAGILREKEND